MKQYLAFVCLYEQRTKQTYTITEAYKLCFRVFWIFLPNVIKIDPYNFELYRFKVDAFFETQCRCILNRVCCLWTSQHVSTPIPVRCCQRQSWSVRFHHHL